MEINVYIPSFRTMSKCLCSHSPGPCKHDCPLICPVVLQWCSCCVHMFTVPHLCCLPAPLLPTQLSCATISAGTSFSIPAPNLSTRQCDFPHSFSISMEFPTVQQNNGDGGYEHNMTTTTTMPSPCHWWCSDDESLTMMQACTVGWNHDETQTVQQLAGQQTWPNGPDNDGSTTDPTADSTKDSHTMGSTGLSRYGSVKSVFFSWSFFFSFFSLKNKMLQMSDHINQNTTFIRWLVTNVPTCMVQGEQCKVVNTSLGPLASSKLVSSLATRTLSQGSSLLTWQPMSSLNSTTTQWRMWPQQHNNGKCDNNSRQGSGGTGADLLSISVDTVLRLSVVLY